MKTTSAAAASPTPGGLVPWKPGMHFGEWNYIRSEELTALGQNQRPQPPPVPLQCRSIGACDAGVYDSCD